MSENISDDKRHQNSFSSESIEDSAATVVANDLSADGTEDIEIIGTEVAKVRGDSKPHAFIVMPFGEKSDRDGNIIDFDRVYYELIKPAVIAADFEPKRADEEFASGDIITDMFQELLLADLVVADMSIDNANVFYELGVRHALRRRGVVHIQAGRSHMPFDVFNVRTIQYQTPDNSASNYKEQLQKDHSNLVRAITNTWKSDLDAIHSPVFSLLTGLKEADRKQLATPLATGFWREQTEWEERIDIAQREKSVGDILILTEEITNPLIKEDALLRSGLALNELGRKKLALKEFRKGLVMNPRNRILKIEVARLQSQLGRVDAAIVRLERMLDEQPDDTKAIRTLGRIYSDLWQERWKTVGQENRRKHAFDSHHWLIKSINTYMDGFYSNLNEFEPGLKALVLSEVLIDLIKEFETDEPDPAIVSICSQKNTLSSAVRVSIDAAARKNPAQYWVHASLAIWELFSTDSDTVSFRRFQNAVSHARGNTGILKTTMRPIDTILALNIQPERALAARTVLTDEIALIGRFGMSKDDTRSVVFSSNSSYSQNATQLTEEQLKELQRRIEIELDNHQAGSFYGRTSHAFVSGVSGTGALTFIECCLRRAMSVHIFLPMEEAKYVKTNLTDPKEISRYYQIKTNESVSIRLQHERLGATEDQANAYTRNIRWTVLSALQASGNGLHLIALAEDGENTTTQDSNDSIPDTMTEQCRDLGGSYTLINTQQLKLLDLGSDQSNQSNQSTKGAISIQERVELLQRCDVLKKLHIIDLQVIASHCIEWEFEKDDVVFTQNDSGTDSYFLLDGELVIYDSEKEVDRRCVAGDIVGEMSTFSKNTRSATVIASKHTSALRLSNGQFKSLTDKRPEILNCLSALYQTRTRQLKESRRQSSSKAQKNTTSPQPEIIDAE